MGYTSLLGELKRTNTGKSLSSRRREPKEDSDKETKDRLQNERLALLKKYYKK